MLNNISCPIVRVRCSVVIIYTIIVRQDKVAVLADNQVAAACSRSVVLNNLSSPIVRVGCSVVITCGVVLPAIVRHIKRSLQ